MIVFGVAKTIILDLEPRATANEIGLPDSDLIDWNFCPQANNSKWEPLIFE